jgi:hypothetical protein
LGGIHPLAVGDDQGQAESVSVLEGFGWLRGRDRFKP